MPTALTPETVGAVDVAVVAFEGNRFNGEIAPALRDLQASGVVRILDLTLVYKDRDGSVSVVELADSEVAGAFEQVLDVEFDLLSDQDLEKVAEALPPESSALVAVWENTWSARLAAAVRDSHGQLLLLERIPRDEVLRAIGALDEDEEA